MKLCRLRKNAPSKFTIFILHYKFNCSKIFLSFSIVLPAHRAIRILDRRYAVTTTEYKYLEIGIKVGPPIYMEIAIKNHDRNEPILSFET